VSSIRNQLGFGDFLFPDRNFQVDWRDKLELWSFDDNIMLITHDCLHVMISLWSSGSV